MAARRTKPEQEIAERIYEEMRASGAIVPRSVYPALVRRVRDWLRDSGDPAMVEMVLSRIARELGAGWNVSEATDPVAFDVVRRRLAVPDGAWGYALWASRRSRRDVRESAEHWLGVWRDAQEAGDEEGVRRARLMLDRLMDYDSAEEIEI